MYKCKFLHVLWHDDIKFNTRLVKMIYDKDNDFDSSQHYYITPHDRVFEHIKQYGNSELILKNFSKINDYLSKYDWIIFHSMPSPHLAIRIKRIYQRKIVWRTWGHDAKGYYRFNGIKGFLKRFLYFFWKQNVKNYRAVGIANIVDSIDIKERFGDIPMIRLSYSVLDDTYDLIRKIDNEPADHREVINVLIGHSCHKEENHIEILKRIEKFKSENMCIYIICSYGDREYIDEVKKYVSHNWDNQSIIINDFLDQESFARLIKKIDVAILDSKRSYALGTIAFLLALHVKIYLNKSGILHRVFDMESIPHGVTLDLENISFEDFSKKYIYNESSLKEMIHAPKNENIATWKNLFDTLAKESSSE